MIALGWANIGAAVAPDAALASVASAIILVQGGQGVKGVGTAIAIAIPLPSFTSCSLNDITLFSSIENLLHIKLIY